MQQVLVNQGALADRGDRFGASLIDGFTTAVVGVVFMGIVGPRTSEIVGYLAFAAFLVYQLYLLATRGQTIGKQQMGIRIARADDPQSADPGRTVLLRTVLGQWLLSSIPFYGLVDVLFIFREDRRCIHDLIAGTCVVQAVLP